MYILYAFLLVYFVFYIIAMVEIIGSWILTDFNGMYWWDFRINILEPALIPFMAFMEALTIYDTAEEYYLYDHGEKYRCRESLFGYLKHNRKTIKEWHSWKNTEQILNKMAGN